MAKMRISPELKKLIEKYRCVKDTEGMSPAKVYKLVGENENLYLKMTDSRYKGTTYDVEREKDMMLDQHIRQTNRKVFLAYIMLKDVNDSDRHAEQLTKLLFKHKKYLPLYHLDLIPYNQTTVTETMVPSSHTRIKAFCRIIHNAGISVNIRTQFGSDINAACGQLAGAYRDDQKQGERTMSARDVKSFGEEVEASC